MTLNPLIMLQYNDFVFLRCDLKGMMSSRHLSTIDSGCSKYVQGIPNFLLCTLHVCLWWNSIYLLLLRKLSSEKMTWIFITFEKIIRLIPTIVLDKKGVKIFPNQEIRSKFSFQAFIQRTRQIASTTTSLKMKVWIQNFDAVAPLWPTSYQTSLIILALASLINPSHHACSMSRRPLGLHHMITLFFFVSIGFLSDNHNITFIHIMLNMYFLLIYYKL